MSKGLKEKTLELSSSVDFSKTLNELAGLPPDPGPYENGLPGRYRCACNTPVDHLFADQIRTLIWQNEGVDILARYLMGLLRLDPLAELDGEECLRLLFDNIKDEFWFKNPDLQAEAVALILELDKSLPQDWIDFAIFFVVKHSDGGSPKLSFWGERPDPD